MALYWPQGWKKDTIIFGKPICNPWGQCSRIYQGNFRRGSKVQGTNEFKQSYLSKALNLSQGLQTRVEDLRWQIKAKHTWHLFSRENQVINPDINIFVLHLGNSLSFFKNKFGSFVLWMVATCHYGYITKLRRKKNPGMNVFICLRPKIGHQIFVTHTHKVHVRSNEST